MDFCNHDASALFSPSHTEKCDKTYRPGIHISCMFALVGRTQDSVPCDCFLASNDKSCLVIIRDNLSMARQVIGFSSKSRYPSSGYNWDTPLLLSSPRSSTMVNRFLIGRYISSRNVAVHSLGLARPNPRRKVSENRLRGNPISPERSNRSKISRLSGLMIHSKDTRVIARYRSRDTPYVATRKKYV